MAYCKYLFDDAGKKEDRGNKSISPVLKKRLRLNNIANHSPGDGVHKGKCGTTYNIKK